jgi:hypothetical protein
MAGLIAACCVCFSPSLNAAVVVETFTDYTAFLNLLGANAQVITFDDVPTVPNPGNPSYRYGYFDSGRYAAQGIVISAVGAQTVLSGPAYSAVSPPNVYSATLSGGPAFPPGAFRDETHLFFTHDGQPALTSAFGAFFVGNTPVDGESIAGLAIGGDANFIHAGLTSQDGSTFLGLATVDSLSGNLVPAISEIDASQGSHALHDAFLDNFTFTTPVSPVPEANVWVLLTATALAAVGRGRARLLMSRTL